MLFRHALPNAMLPVITLSALAFGDLLAGAVLVEAVFSWPGVGGWVAQSILSQDYAPVQAAIILAALVYSLLNLFADILYGVVDPREDRAMKLGAYFLPVEFETYLESVRCADRAGFSHAWVCDSQMIWQDPYVYMARGLQATERLTFGTAVTNPITRHFTVTASGHATLASSTSRSRRARARTRRQLDRTLGLKPAKVAQMRELVPEIKRLLAGQPIDFEGTEIRIPWAGARVPLMLGGTGPTPCAWPARTPT